MKSSDLAIVRFEVEEVLHSPDHTIAQSPNLSMFPPLGDVEDIENREPIQHAGGDQKRGAVIGAWEKRVAARVTEERGEPARQACPPNANVAKRFEIRARASVKNSPCIASPNKNM